MYSLRFVSLGLLLAFGTPTVGHADELEQLLVRFERGLGVGDEDAPAVADELVEWGRQQNNKEAEARGLLRQAFLQMVPRNEDSGWRQRVQEALKIAGDENTVLRAEAALFHAYSMGRVDNRVEAIAEVDKAIELAHAVDADRVIALGYIMNAELLRVHSSELRSRDYCLRALLFAEQVESPGLVLLALRRTVGVMAFFECYEEGVAYAERLQELATAEGAGIESMGTAERLLYKAGRNPEYETRLRGRIVAMKKQLGASRRTRIARLQIQLAGLIRDKSPQEAAEVVAEAIATFEAVDDRAWIVFGKLVQAIVPLPDDKKSSAYNRLQAVLNGKKIAPVSENSRFLGWLADSANIDLAEFYEKQGTWQDAAEWRREETVRLRQWANNGTGNAAVSAQSFLEDTLRARRERQRMFGERKQMAAEREEMAVERSDFAEERDRFSRTQLGLMWIAGLAVAGSFGTRMYVVSRHRKQLQEEVNRKTASLQLAKQEAEEARDRAERADRVKTDFLACMNHEIRNPLNAILGYSQVLQQDSTEDRRKDLRGIESSTEHLLQLANNVLDMSSIENGEIEIHKRAFDLHDLCESVDDILQNSAARKSIAFYVEIASSVPRQVVGDESKIRQVLINLCSNGIKFTQEGQVKLALSVVDELNGQFHLRARVTDTGSGMTDEEMGLLFKPYSQSAMSRDQRMGSGLGLYICKSFVERMGGTITGKNQAEGGAEFEMVVPLEIGSTPAEACEKTAEQSPPVAGTKILIVDDNEANLQTIARLLNAMGFEAKTAHAKATAIAEVQSWQPDVVFLDIHMPGADGFEVANAIRKTEVGPGVKIIAVTGDAIESVRRRALSNGFDAFLPKPIRMKAIEQAIGELLRS